MAARSYATVQCSIWENREFVALSPQAQCTYFMLITQPDLEACGSLDLTLRRWARYVSSGDRALLASWIIELAQARFVVVDEDYEELLVRTFVKYDNGYRHATRVKAVVSSAEALRSPRLRAFMALELDRLGVAHKVQRPVDNDAILGVESLPSATHADSSEPALDSHQTGTGVALDSHSTGTGQGVESPGSVVKKRNHQSTPHSTIHKGEPQPLESHPDSPNTGGQPSPTPEPPPTCTRHPDGTDEPCGPCKAARLTHDAWTTQEAERVKAERATRRDTERAARRQAIETCNLCDHHGYRHLNNGNTGAVCNHQPLNPGARQRAFAQTQNGTDDA